MSKTQTVQKTVNLNLTQVNSNAFALMGAFQAQAEREGWTKDEIDAVIAEAKKDDYNHLVGTLAVHCKPK